MPLFLQEKGALQGSCPQVGDACYVSDQKDQLQEDLFCSFSSAMQLQDDYGEAEGCTQTVADSTLEESDIEMEEEDIDWSEHEATAFLTDDEDEDDETNENESKARVR